jgi:Tol biopolymer transport system component
LPIVPNAQPERVSLGGVDAITPTTSRKTDTIAWVNQLWDLNIYRIGADGNGRPVRLIASTLRDQGAEYSPDGRIAFVSDRSGSREIWVARGDGSRQVRVTNLKGSPIDHLAWSPDGRQLAFAGRLSGRSGTFVLPCDPGPIQSCGEPKLLTPDELSTGATTWSLDGKFLYFASDRTGRWEIWKRPASGGQPSQVTRDGGYMSRESPDRKWLYFSKSDQEAIFRMPLSGVSGAELVVGAPYRVQSRGWSLTRSELFFVDRGTQDHSTVIRAYNPSTRAIRSIVSLDENFTDRDDIGFSVSPDEKWVLYSQLDRSGSNVMLADSR